MFLCSVQRNHQNSSVFLEFCFVQKILNIQTYSRFVSFKEILLEIPARVSVQSKKDSLKIPAPSLFCP